MCNSRSSKKTPFDYFEDGKKITKWKKVDKCLSGLLCFINGNTSFRTLGSCCGHCRYPMSIVCKSPFGFIVDICSGEIIPRTRNFYKMDSEGYYYLPESVKSQGKRRKNYD